MSQAPRVCILKSRRYPLTPGQIVDGGTLHVYKLVETLVDRGYDVDVFTRLEHDEPAILRQGRVTLFSVPFDRSSYRDTMARDYEEGESFVASVVGSEYFKAREYLCINTHHWTSTVGLAPVLPPQCRLFHTPHLLAVEKASHNEQNLPPEVEAAEREILRRADAVFALSLHEASVIGAYYQVERSKVFVTPNGVDERFLALPIPEFERPHTTPLLFIGRLCKQKGLDAVVTAIGELVHQGMSPFAYIVGGSYGESAYENAVLAEIHARHLTPYFHIAGQVPHEEILRFMDKAAIYVQPSRYESQGIALLEAMAAGRAVVASALPAISEYITHGSNGLLVKPAHGSSVADAVLQVFDNPAASRAMALEARSRAKQFTWAAAWNTMLPVLTGGHGE